MASTGLQEASSQALVGETGAHAYAINSVLLSKLKKNTLVNILLNLQQSVYFFASGLFLDYQRGTF